MMKTTRILSAASLLFFFMAVIGIAPNVSAQETGNNVIIDAPGAQPQDPVIIDTPNVYPQDPVITDTPNVYPQDPVLDSAPGSPLDEDELDDLDDMEEEMEEMEVETYQSETSRDVAAGSPAGPWVERTGSYMVLKGGVYAPSSDGDLSDIDFEDDNGFAGEVAVGHYLLPFLAVEVGAGYFQSKNSPALPAGTNTMLRVVPLVATGKVFLPLGVFEPYGLFGIGAYISDVDVRDDNVDFDGESDVTFGLHAGAGFNINFNEAMFLGLEGKYLWAEPELGGRDVDLDGYITTVNVGFRF